MHSKARSNAIFSPASKALASQQTTTQQQAQTEWSFLSDEEKAERIAKWKAYKQRKTEEARQDTIFWQDFNPFVQRASYPDSVAVPNTYTFIGHPSFEQASKQEQQQTQAPETPKAQTNTVEEQSNFDYFFKADKFWSETDWILGIVLLSAIIFAFIKFAYNRYLNSTIESAYKFNLARKLLSENSSLSQRVSGLMSLVFVLNFSMLVYHSINHFSHTELIDPSSIVTYLIVTATITGIYAGKYLFLGFLGYLLNAKSQFKEYMFNVWLYNKLVGIGLFLFIITIPFIENNTFAHVLIILAYFLFAIGSVARYIRGIRILREKHVSLFYMILYFCTLEILPLSLLVKILQDINKPLLFSILH